MARRLGEVVNEMIMKDKLSDTEICFFYRFPTTKERVAYENERFQRKKKKVVNRTVETRLKYGLKILKGVRIGDFVKEIDGEWKPISSDSGAEHYDPDWKEHVEKYAADLVMELAFRVFEFSVEETEDDDEETEGEDLEKN